MVFHFWKLLIDCLGTSAIKHILLDTCDQYIVHPLILNRFFIIFIGQRMLFIW